MILQQKSKNGNPNTNQTGRLYDLSRYELASVDYRTGEARVKSPRMRTPRERFIYTVYLYAVPAGKKRCSCPGFASWGRCRHSGVDGIAWSLAWNGEGQVGSKVGQSFSGVYIWPGFPVDVRADTTRFDVEPDDWATDGEAEAVNRWLYVSEWEVA